MNAVPFDTLKFARRLEQAGMTAPVAAGTAEALAEAMSVSELATKSDLAGLRTEMAGLRTELKGDIDSLRSELKADIVGLRSELTGLRSELKGDANALRT